jgi:glycosyltransferase involved in cell wall biosynthesis
MISVVCPVFNEEKYIVKVLDFIVHSAPAEKELIVIDGGSTDATRSIVEEWSRRYPFIRLLDNPSKYVPYALNKAIPLCKGDVIVRLDAHTEYAPDYFTSVLEAFRKSGADIVGGPMRAAGGGIFQKAVAYCTSTAFGVGDSAFHDETAEGFVDSVYLGAWKKRVFTVAGYFDEQMHRNQDDEFHYRAVGHGFRIYLDPSIRSLYFPRSTPSALYRQYFQYGLFKPLVLKKVRSGMKIRHLVPSFFLAYLIASPLIFRFAGWCALVPLMMYACLDLYFSFKGKVSWRERFNRLLVYPLLHVSYGAGFIMGLGKKNRTKNYGRHDA